MGGRCVVVLNVQPAGSRIRSRRRNGKDTAMPVVAAAAVAAAVVAVAAVAALAGRKR